MIEYIKGLKIEEIAGLIALVISVISILYAYKGIKHSKYVETITNQRIKWIDILRSDFSRILTLAILLKSLNDQDESASSFMSSNEYNELELEDKDSIDEQISNTKKKKKEIIKKISEGESINTIELAILRLNDKDDKDLIEKLEIMKNCFLKGSYKSITDVFIVKLRSSIKQLLKNEWEKVKLEVKRGRLVNEPNKRKSWI